MAISRLIEKYKGFEIRRFNSGHSRSGELFIRYENGTVSPITAKTLAVAKKVIDVGIRSGIGVWDVIEAIYPGIEEKAVYSNKNWAA